MLLETEAVSNRFVRQISPQTRHGRPSDHRATVSNMYAALIIGFVGGLVAAWLGAAVVHWWDVKRRTVAVVARVEIIVRRDLSPPLILDPNHNERAQLVLDWADDRVRTSEEELRSLAIERRGYRHDLQSLAEALDSTWQAYHLLVYLWTLPEGHPSKSEPDALGYLDKHTALGQQVAELRGRLESRLPCLGLAGGDRRE